MSEQIAKSKFGIAFFVSLIASVMIMVSSSLVWFREEVEVFGQSFGGLSVKGTELGDLAEIGVSVVARGEYVIVLGAFALVLTAACFFVPSKKKLMASLIGIIAVLCIGIGLEPTLRFVGEGTMPGEGVYLLFVASVVLLIVAFRLPSAVKIGARIKEVAPPVFQSWEPTQERVIPQVPEVEPGPVRATVSAPPPVVIKPADRVTEPIPTTPEVTLDRNRLIAVAIGLIVLAIFSGMVFKLPGTATRMGNLYVGNVITLVIMAVMIILVVPARHRLANVINYHTCRIFKVQQNTGRGKVKPDIYKLSVEVANIVVIGIMWPIVTRVVSVLLRLDRHGDFHWVSIVVTLALVAILLYRMYRGYQSLEAVLAGVGKASLSFSCPKCGATNTAGTKFCSSCGSMFQAPPVEKTIPVSLPCTKCGAENVPGSKFCNNCGVPLSEK